MGFVIFFFFLLFCFVFLPLSILRKLFCGLVGGEGLPSYKINMLKNVFIALFLNPNETKMPEY